MTKTPLLLHSYASILPKWRETFTIFHLTLQGYVCFAESPTTTPASTCLVEAAGLLLDIVRSLHNGLKYPKGDCIVLPVVICWYSVSDIVCHAFNPTAGSTRIEWNHNTKLNVIIISCNEWLNL